MELNDIITLLGNLQYPAAIYLDYQNFKLDLLDNYIWYVFLIVIYLAMVYEVIRII